MKKNRFFIFLLFINLPYTYSQEYNIGLKGGLNYSNIGTLYHLGTNSGGGNGVIPFEDTNYKADKEIGFNFGAFFMVSFDKIFIRSEINFVSLKNSYPLAQKTAQWTASKIDIPILIGVEISNPVSVYAGPAFNLISTMKLQGVESPIVFKKTAVNLNAGILVDFGRLGIDVRYEYGFKSILEQRVDIVRAIYGTNVARLLKYNPSQIIVSLHINLLKINGNGGRGRVVKSWRYHKNL